MLRNLNVKAIFCLFFLLLSLSSGPGIWANEQENALVPEGKVLKFAAWNIENLGTKKRDESHFRIIADMLSEYHFVAITELRHIKDLDEVMTILCKEKGRNYGYLVSPKVGWRDSPHWEYYVFLYDKDLVSVVDVGGLFPDSTNRYRGKFIRNPYWVTFRADNFDFTVVVVHIEYGDGVIAPQEENREIGKVVEYVQDKNGPENDVILVGDFNLDPSDKAFENLLNKVEPKVTALFEFDKNRRNETASNISGTKLYDNIFIQNTEGYVTEYIDDSKFIYRFDEDRFKNDDVKARRISNHRPVIAKFRIDVDDDDLKEPNGDAH